MARRTARVYVWPERSSRSGGAAGQALRTVVAVTQGPGEGVFLSMQKIKMIAVSAALASALWLPAAAEAARSWR